MPAETNKEKRITVRMTNSRHAELTTYAKAHNMTLTKAVEELLELGLKAQLKPPAEKSDIERIETKLEALEAKQQTSATLLLDAIKNQPIAVQPLPAPTEEEQDEPKKQGFFKRLFS
jgi:uncharacterized coiled-coil DUF342 family protein